MSVVIKSGAGTDTASVDANKRLFVNLPTAVSLQPGFVAIAAEVTDGTAPISGMAAVTRTVRSGSVSIPKRERVGSDTIIFYDTFNHATLNANVYQGVDSSMTKAVSGGFLTLNSGSSVTISNTTRVQTYRFFQAYGDTPLYVDIWFQISVTAQANNVCEWGWFLATGTATPTDGCYFRLNSSGNIECVINSNGTETITTVTSGAFSTNTTYHSRIAINDDAVEFYINGVLVASQVARTAAAPGTTFSGALPLHVREYNSGAVGSAQQFKISRWTVSLGDVSSYKPWNEAMSGSGLNGIYSPPGVATATGTANYANSAAPTAAVLSNNAASYTTLGGQWLATTVNSAETDFMLFGYVNPAGSATIPGRNLYINYIRVGETLLTATIIGSTPLNMQWGVAIGGLNGASLATTDSTSAGTRAYKRLAIGSQAMATTVTAAGALAAGFSHNFIPPLMIEPNSTFAVVAKFISATNVGGAGLGYRGTVSITGNWE